MKKTFIYSAVLALALVFATSCETSCEEWAERDSIEDYTSDSLRVYYMACGIVFPLRDYYLAQDEEERQYCTLHDVNPKDRETICTTANPSLWVLARAIYDMDATTLADAVDCDIIDEFYEALNSYMAKTGRTYTYISFNTYSYMNYP